jgi:adenine nucleotide transporter 17
MTAMTVFFPLDTIRSRLQVEEHRKSKDTITMIKELINSEGMYGFTKYNLYFN